VGQSSLLSYTVGFIELQAGYFEAGFLEWFILAFIAPLLSPMHILGSDWGIDEIYCNAAKQYKAITTSHDAATRHPICAVVIDNLAVHHRNRRSIKDTMGGKGVHLQLNCGLMRIVHKIFRNSCSHGLRRENDPFNPNTSYMPSYRLRADCHIQAF
jgi:hypothetical protein